MNRDEFTVHINDLISQYDTEINNLPFSKKQRGDLLAGFRDGVRSTVVKLTFLKLLKIEE